MAHAAHLLCAGVLALAGACAQSGAAQDVADDPMLPTSSVADATTSPIRAMTIMSGDLDATRRFFQAGMDMSAELITLEGAEADAIRMQWGVEAAGPIEMALFRHPEADGAAIVRAVQAPEGLAVMRQGYDSRPIGPLGFGFAGDDLEARRTIMEALGYETTAGVMYMDFPRADGTTYEVSEIHFKAPDDMLILAVNRGPKQPVGPIDPALGIGGVAYASLLVGDLEASDAFLGDVLGLERRRDISFNASGPGGGMVGLRAGEEVAFQQWFSQGARTGYLVVMALLEGPKSETELGFEQRGVAMWSFEVDDLAAVLDRYGAAGGAPVSGPSDYVSPGLGLVRGAIIENPDGLPVEVYERAP